MGDCEFVAGYSELSLHSLGPLSRTCGSEHPIMVAHFRLKSDISCLLPYINAVARDATFYEKPEYIKFNLNGFLCGLHPSEGSAGLFEDSSQAHEFVQRLVAFLNQIHRNRKEIRPNPRRRSPIPVLEIYKLLPRRNCGECGYPCCMAFAAALSRREGDPGQCVGLGQPLRQCAVYPVYDADGNLEKTVAIDIDTARIAQGVRETQERILKLEQELTRLMRVDRFPSGSCGTDSLPTPLTDRELQVLGLLARGASNTEISDLLRISPHTVKSHVIHIFNKLSVDSRTEAAVWAARHHLI